jgi:hypothetical protein
MNGSVREEVTVLLAEISKGDEGAASKLIPLVYDELRRLAGGYMRRERADHTLQPTALVHEAISSWSNSGPSTGKVERISLALRHE